MKKITLIIVTVALCAVLFAACGAPAAAPSDSAPAESAQASDSAEPTESAQASDSAQPTEAAAGNTDYMSWTGADWDAAAEEEKFAAAEATLLAVGDAMMDNYAELVEQAKTNDQVKEQIDKQVKTLQSSIASFFKSSPDSKLSDLVAASKKVVDSNK